MIPEWLYGLGGLVLCVLLVPYVLGPILVFFTLRFRMPPLAGKAACRAFAG